MCGKHVTRGNIYHCDSGSEGGPRGAVPPLALLLPPLDSQYYIDTRLWSHTFTLYSEVKKSNGQIEENSYKCTFKVILYIVKKVRQISLNCCAKIEIL